MSRRRMPQNPTPVLNAPFRTTRSGSAFSPWGGVVNPPLHAPPAFNAQERIEAAVAQGDLLHYTLDATSTRPAVGDLGDEEHEVTGGDTMDDVTEAAPSQPLTLPPSLIPPPPAQRRRGLAKEAVVSINAEGCEDDRCQSATFAKKRKAPPAFDTPAVEAPPSQPEGSGDTISKKQFRAKQRKKAARNSKRAAAGVNNGMNRPLKSVARMRAAAHTVLSLPNVDVAGLVVQDAQSAPPVAAEALATTFSMDMADVRVASTAFQGVRYRASQVERNARERADYEAKGYRYIAWDGRTTTAILDRDGHPIVVLQGFPGDREDWMREVNDPLSKICDDLRAEFRFKKTCNQRAADDFKTINFGISFGGGQQRVGRLVQGSHTNYALVDGIRNHPAVLRMANFANAGLQLFWPKIYTFYNDILSGIISRDSTLKRNFPNNVFACASLNVGPRTVTAPHYDYLNIPFGLCSITALGRFDPKTGGQIVLDDLEMIIEFPPGSTIEIPSAIVKHSNLSIGEDEVRYSFTQYTAGGLFRWWECGYRSYKSFVNLGMKFGRSGLQRWQWGVELLGKWGDIKHMFKTSNT